MPPIPQNYILKQQTDDLINTFNSPVEQFTDTDTEVEPLIDDKKDNFPIYAELSEDVYNKVDKRNNIRNYKYLQNESNDNYGVYENDDEYHISIKGTSKESLTKDLVQDLSIGLGSLGLGLSSTLSGDINEVQNKINTLKKNNKKISLSGSSKGGSIASYLGIDNPEIDTITFNKGSGLPFISDMIKCKIYGCNNIKNYRISGDFASVIGNKIDNQLYETLRPKFPSKEDESTADQLQDFAIEKDLYIPHSINQFIGRNPDNLDSQHRYARKLASKTGRLLGFAGSIVAPQFLSKIGNIAKGNQLIEDIIEGDFIPEPEDLENLPRGVLEQTGISNLVSPTRSNRILPVLEKINNYGGQANIFARGVTGYNLGGIIGTGVYNVLYDSDLLEIKSDRDKSGL